MIKKNGHRWFKVAIYIILSFIMLVLIYITYHSFINESISVEIYSTILMLLVGAFFLFLQRAYSVRTESVLEKLSIVPEIQNLIIDAKEKSIKIENLQEEIKKLEYIVDVSASKYYLNKRYTELEKQLKTTYDELKSVRREIEELKVPVEEGLTRQKIEEIEKFIRHRERGDLIIHIGKRRYAISKELFDTYPLGGLGLIVESISKFQNKLNNMIDKMKSK